VPRKDWRFLAVLLALAAAWWVLTLARGCGEGKPRPLELIPAKQQQATPCL
jgi:hypothetical protein